MREDCVSSSRTAEIYHSIRHELFVGGILVMMLVGGIGGWAALASLESAERGDRACHGGRRGVPQGHTA
jgi:hypothetical protein